MNNIILLSKTYNFNKILKLNKSFKKQNKNIKIKTINVLDIKAIKNSLDEFLKTQNSFDGLIFTSKNGVKVFFELLSKTSKNKFITQTILNKKYYALSNKTYKQLKKCGINNKNAIDMECENAFEMAKKLTLKLKNKKVAIIRAKKVLSSMSSILADSKIVSKEFKIYKTSIKNINQNKYNISTNSIVIFSSPSTIKGFLKNYKWKNSFQAVLIGKSTRGFLPKNINYKMAKTPSIKECIKCAISMLG